MKKLYILFGIVIFVFVLSFIIAGFEGVKESSVSSFSKEDASRPIATIKKTDFDLGDMTVDDIKDYEFEITNKGKSDLVLTQLSTSCDCTYAYVIQNGKQSEKFSMIGNRDYKVLVTPEETVKIKAVYEPSIMPVEGPVTRFVNISTNDPNNPKIQFKLTANVSKK